MNFVWEGLASRRPHAIFLQRHRLRRAVADVSASFWKVFSRTPRAELSHNTNRVLFERFANTFGAAAV